MIARPPEIMSSDAISFANVIGSRSITRQMPVPSEMCFGHRRAGGERDEGIVGAPYCCGRSPPPGRASPGLWEYACARKEQAVQPALFHRFRQFHGLDGIVCREDRNPEFRFLDAAECHAVAPGFRAWCQWDTSVRCGCLWINACAGTGPCHLWNDVVSWWGLLLGGAFGFLLGGPIGAVAGRGPGSGFRPHRRHTRHRGVRGIAARARAARFFAAVFGVMGHVAKADGRVTPKRSPWLTRVMDQLGLDGRQRTAPAPSSTKESGRIPP